MSLRDVDRTLQVMMWFYDHKVLFELMDRKAAAELNQNPELDEEELASFEVVLFLVFYSYCLFLMLFHDEQP